ncbi:alpha/beta fold hydrolase [uncultured Roseobacter sp.]|uniref:alpha/beta hydrolase n=1 Tax=uncultured Roseobacter sp. TaxID=114847 RepID=UPI00262B22D9|nr:alpha/beta fold hydrolase [uncultured Roseobacter sp.]
MTFGELVVSIPPGHVSGQVEWPTRRPDPARHFAVQSNGGFSSMRRMQSEISKGRGPVTLFVHGYNNTFTEAAFRHAQIAHDLNLTGDQVMFSWASLGVPPGYLYDRDSALQARRPLADLIADLASDSANEVVLVAHSMGAFLTMEALRELSNSGRSDVLRRINRIMLISPDINEAVFLSQIAEINPLPQPMVVTVNREDRVLRVSSRLSGQETRVGLGQHRAALDARGITVLDLTEFAATAGDGHFIPATSETILGLANSLGRGLDD